jgi:tetratricopeptide (TPR) repeat protein
LVEKAVGYLLIGGQQAIRRGAITEAVAQLRKGLDLLSGVPDGAERQEHELDLQMTLGHALIATKGYSAPEPGEAFARARQLCEELKQLQQLGPILLGQFAFYAVRGELYQAERHAQEMRELGEAQNDPVWQFYGSATSGNICFYLGKFIDARAHSEKALSIWDPMYGGSSPSPEDRHANSLLNLSRTLLCLGYIDQAHLRRDEALAEARQLHFTIWLSLYAFLRTLGRLRG